MAEKTLIDKLALLYIEDGKLLCSMSHGKDTCYIPGGKREAGESDEQALRREIMEELSVELVDGRSGTMARLRRRHTASRKA